jgi:CDP-diacylglycerol--serine O-phosphatidyltransferase
MSLVWIPNSFTLGNLFFGFTAMLAALRGRFDLAALFIFICLLLDMLDGRIARAIKTDNPMGKELDSFADMISFGIAPGVIFYAAFLGNKPVYYDLEPFICQSDFLLQLTEYNWLHILFGALAFLFPLAASIRLARFNIHETGDTFSGCPSPAAGGLVVLTACFSQIPGMSFLEPYGFEIPSVLLIILFIIMDLLMIVKIPFSKPQTTFLSKSGLSRPPLLVYNLVVVAALILFFKYFLVLCGCVYVFWSLLRRTVFKKRIAR